MSERAAPYRPSRALIAGLCAIIFVSAVSNGYFARGAFTAVLFCFCVNWVIRWLVHATTPKADDTVIDGGEDPALAAVLARLDATRVEIAAAIDRRMRIRLPLGIGAGVLAWGWTQWSPDPGGPIELGMFALTGAGFGWVSASATLAARYRRLYKAEVLPQLAASFGELVYRPANPDIDLLRQQRLFRNFSNAEAEDEIVGNWHGLPISIVELKLTRRQNKSTVIVFDGLLTRVTLPRMLSGTTAIIPDAGMLGNLRDALGGPDCERIRLEDPDFEALYQVYGTDQVGARALLTPAFMQRFLALGARGGFARPVALAQGNDLTIALAKQAGGDLFEPPDYRRPAGSRAALAKLRANIGAVLDLADAVIDLDHATRGRLA